MIDLRFWFFVIAAACTAAVLPAFGGTPSGDPAIQRTAWQSPVQAPTAGPEGCLQCHQGIEAAGPSHPIEMGCTACHGGNPRSQTQKEAHATLIYDPDAGTGKRNPSALKVVPLTCGQAQCHAGFTDPSLNWADHVRKSPMGTLAGMIAGLRFQWSGQTGRDAKFGVYPVEDEDGDTPAEAGAVKRLSRLPYFTEKTVPRNPPDKQTGGAVQLSRHFADHLLRDECFQCHLDAPAPEGVFRSQGCAACHSRYNETGTYEGGDPTVPKDEPGHPATHAMAVLPPENVCVQCHRQFDTTQAPLAGVRADAVGADLRFAGAGRPVQDAHLAKGMECIDCHTAFDVMGDGNIYSRQHQAVEVRCETCHGTETHYPETAVIEDASDPAVRWSRHYPEFDNKVGDAMVLTAHGNKMSNVKKIGKKYVMFGKRTGKRWDIPQTAWQRKTHTLPGHNGKLECTACHSQWVPKCQGCHIAYDTAAHERGRDPWSAGRSRHRQWPQPRLMMGPRGKVAPVLEQPRRTLTVLDGQGHPLPVINESGDREGEYKEWQFTNPLGYSGSNLVYAAQPHSVRKTVRACADCHLSPRTLGLGEGELEIRGNSSGKDDEYNFLVLTDIKTLKSHVGPEADVTIRGQPIAGAGQQEARPLNQAEIGRILRAGNCIACHDRYEDPVYRDMDKSYKFALTGKHRQLRNKILRKR